MKQISMFALPLAALVAAPAAHAQYSNARYPSQSGTAVYEWQGGVDQEVRLQLRDTRSSEQRIGPREPGQANGRFLSAIPRQDGMLYVERLQGRGRVDVIQQPNSSNGYTAVVRLADDQAGAAAYRFVAYWQPTQGGYGRGNGGNVYGNNGGYANDGRYGNTGGYGNNNGVYGKNSSHDVYGNGGYGNNGGYDRNGDRAGNNGHAYGHDQRDRDDRRADRRDDRRDRKDDRRDRKDHRDDHRDGQNDHHDDHHDDGNDHGWTHRNP